MGSTMTKADLVEAVAAEAGISRVAASASVDALLGVVTQALRDGQEVRLTGFGSFMISERKATKGRNPRTGEGIAIPASRSVRFKPGKTLKDAVG